MATENTTLTTTGQSNTDKPTDEWVTGDEPMTGAQRSYLMTLASETGHEVPADLTKAAASKLIDELRAESDRIADDEANEPDAA